MTTQNTRSSSNKRNVTRPTSDQRELKEIVIETGDYTGDFKLDGIGP